MFIFLDESLGQSYITVGCLCVPLDLLPSQEADFIARRIKNKCWGELDWGGISKEYIDKYKNILENYLSHEKITFHSWTYQNPEKEFKGERDKLLYQHEYLLLKYTLMKCLNAGYRTFHILLDDGRSGLEHKLTRDYLDKTVSFRPKPEIAFFSPVDSRIIGAMQIASICVSTVRSLYESETTKGNKRLYDDIVQLLTTLNSNIPLDFSPKKPVWNLSKKFTHCFFDPLLKKPEYKTLSNKPPF